MRNFFKDINMEYLFTVTTATIYLYLFTILYMKLSFVVTEQKTGKFEIK